MPVALDLSAPRRTSPLGAVFGLLRTDRLRPLLPAIVIAISSGRVWLVLTVVVVGGIGYGVLAWWRRTWRLAEGVLHLDEGVLTRNQRRIPVERIQHVELERRLRHQLFGLAAVRVETAGGTGPELRLDPIEVAEADLLRATVLAQLRARGSADEADVADAAESAGPASRPDATGMPPPPPARPEVLVRLPPGRLLLAGITGPEVAAVLAAMAFAIDSLADLGVDPETIESVDVTTAFLGLAVLVGVPLWFLTAGLIAVVRKWDLTAAVVGDELRVTYGLLRRNEFVVKTERVQDARIHQRLLLRPFGRANLRVRTAASGSDEQSRVDIPLLGPDEIERVVARVVPDAVPLPALHPAPAQARRRAMWRSTVAAVPWVAAAAVVAVSAGLGAWSASAGALLPVGTARGVLWYRGLGLACERHVVHSRTGSLTRTTAIVPVERVQSSAVRSSLFQRRRGLATVGVDLVGTRIDVPDRAVGEARALSAEVTTDD